MKTFSVFLLLLSAVLAHGVDGMQKNYEGKGKKAPSHSGSDSGYVSPSLLALFGQADPTVSPSYPLPSLPHHVSLILVCQVMHLVQNHPVRLQEIILPIRTLVSHHQKSCRLRPLKVKYPKLSL